MPEGHTKKDRNVLQPIGMHVRYGPFLRSFFARYFDPIRFPAEAIERIKALQKIGTVVYVSPSANLVHFLYLNHICNKHQLPLARFVNGVDPVMLQPIDVLLERMRTLGTEYEADIEEEGDHLPRRQLESVLRAGQTALVYLDTPTTLTHPGSSSDAGLFETLISCQRAQDKPIFLVPNLILYDQHPKMETKALTDAVFGLHESPGFLRSLFQVLKSHRRAFMKVAEPIHLGEFLDQHPGAGRKELTGFLHQTIEEQLQLEVFDVAGPSIRHHVEFKHSILQDPEIRKQVDSMSEGSETKSDALWKKAYDLLDEIAAEPRVYWPLALDSILKVFWKRMYEGFVVDPADFEKVRAAIRKSPVIFCPSHKSHVDYLILSQLCLKFAIPIPHIAAGVNLSFWPMGPIFRHSGAFFMRRSFKDNILYPIIFRTYLRYVMAEGFPIEFFIEGTRSRTGKLLGPRFGILSWLISAFQEGRDDDIQFFPISIDYEKIVESGAYIKELTGGDKRKENVAGLLKSRKALKSKYGKIYVQVGDAISVKDTLQQRGVDRKGLSKESRRSLVQEIGHRILFGINQVSTVTPSALLAISILTHRRRGITHEDLLTRARWTNDWIRRKGHNRFSAVLDDFPRAMAEAATRFSRDGLISIQNTGAGQVYAPLERRRLGLDYYRNNILHHFVPVSIFTLALESFSVHAVPMDALAQRIKELSRLFKFEFLFRSERHFETVVRHALDDLLLEGAVSEENGFVIKLAEAAEKRELFCAIIEHFVENYWLAAKCLDFLQQQSMTQKDFLARTLSEGDRLFSLGDLHFHESLNRNTLKNAMQYFAERKVIEMGPSEGRKGPRISLLEPYHLPEPRDELAASILRYLRR